MQSYSVSEFSQRTQPTRYLLFVVIPLLSHSLLNQEGIPHYGDRLPPFDVASHFTRGILSERCSYSDQPSRYVPVVVATKPDCSYSVVLRDLFARGRVLPHEKPPSRNLSESVSINKAFY